MEHSCRLINYRLADNGKDKLSINKINAAFADQICPMNMVVETGGANGTGS
jgi:hypothetical protein